MNKDNYVINRIQELNKTNPDLTLKKIEDIIEGELEEDRIENE